MMPWNRSAPVCEAPEAPGGPPNNHGSEGRSIFVQKINMLQHFPEKFLEKYRNPIFTFYKRS